MAISCKRNLLQHTFFKMNWTHELHQLLDVSQFHQESLEEEGCHLWYCWKGMGSARSSPDSRWRRFLIVTAARKSDRSRIGAFLPDSSNVRCHCPWYLLNSSLDRRYEWSSCANLSISMHFYSVQPILCCESRYTWSRKKKKRSWSPS